MDNTNISGALFDFLGFLTTRNPSITLGSTYGSAIAHEALEEWAQVRGLILDGANVEGWNKPGPVCCQPGCGRDAQFTIHGSSGHFEDYTEACQDHVGALLGTPTWMEKLNESYHVFELVPGGCDG